MYCRECGATHGPSDATCRVCGRVLSLETPEVSCPRCQGEIGADAGFCTHCGMRQVSDARTATPESTWPERSTAPERAPATGADGTGTTLLSAAGTSRVETERSVPRPWGADITPDPSGPGRGMATGSQPPPEAGAGPSGSARAFQVPQGPIPTSPRPPAAPGTSAVDPATGPGQVTRRSAGLRPAETAASRRAHAEQVDTTTFISESDLPAWLRQVVETEEAQSRAAKQAEADMEARAQAKAAEGARAAAARATADAARQAHERAARSERARAAAEAADVAASRAATAPPSLPTPDTDVTFDTSRSWSAPPDDTGKVEDFSLPYASPLAPSGTAGQRPGRSSRAGFGARVLMVGSVLLIVFAMLLLLAPGLFS